jgi:hypothetical protein
MRHETQPLCVSPRKKTRKAKSLILMALTGLFTPAFANLPPTPDLNLRGQSVGTWAFFSIYDAQLYLAPDTSAQQVLSAQTPGRLEICYRRAIRKEQLIEAAQHVLDKRALSTQAQAQVDALHGAYRDVKKGDCFVMDYAPQSGMTLFFNGQIVHQEPDPQFKQTYWQVWLGEVPLSERVRDELLGLSDSKSSETHQ